MSPHFVLGRENVPCVTEVVNRSLKADCTDFSYMLLIDVKNFEKRLINFVCFFLRHALNY